MEIRKANLKDLKDIDEIYVTSCIDEVRMQFPKRPRKNIERELVKWKKDRLKGFRKDILSKNNYWVVVEEKEKIVGFGEAVISKRDKKTADITMVYLKKDFRKRGIGSKIMNELLRWLRKKKVKFVSGGAFVKNKPSLSLCKKFGFGIVAVRMEKKL